MKVFHAVVVVSGLALAGASGCTNACDTAIDHINGCGLSALPAADSSASDAGADAGADASAPEAGSLAPTQEVATACTGVLACDATCINQASCVELAQKDSHGPYQRCLEQCASGQ